MKKTTAMLRVCAMLLLAAMLGSLVPTAAALTEPFYSVVSPIGASAVEKITQAPRLDTLAGKTIALVGYSFNASVTHEALRERILADYPTAKVYTASQIPAGGTFSVFNPSAKTKAFQEKLKELKVDAVISGNCGCGLCTLKESGSSIAAEYIGIPTVTVGAGRFIPEIRSTGFNRGVPVLRTATYPGAFSSDTVETLRKNAVEAVYPEVVKALTTPISQEEIEGNQLQVECNYDDILISGTNDTLQQYFTQAGYSDGLPIGLPTKEAVETYLQYTPYKGSDVLGTIPPAYRECRVYTVAANAVMAGCPAEYMPLCVAFVKCMSNGEWRRPLASTHGWSPYAWLNGPVARQLGIDCGQGMITEPTNKALGRFIELAMRNIGGYYIKENRMGTFGYLTPWTFSEDEEACSRIGWQPYHVANGYNWNDNTLTAASALNWGNNVTPATPDAEQTMQLIAWDATEKEQNGLGNTNPQVWRTLFVTEAVAKNLSTAYASKSDLEDALVKTARRPLWLRTYAHYWANTGSYQYTKRTIGDHYKMLLKDPDEMAAETAVPSWLRPLFPDKKTIVTVATMQKGQTPILVCGDAERNKFQIMPGGGYVTVKIELPENWDELMSEKGYAPLADYYVTPTQTAKTENTATETAAASENITPVSEIVVRVRLSERTVGQNSTRKMNVAGIRAEGAAKVEHSVDGKNWTVGTAVTSTEAITSFYIRVTDGSGKTAIWAYKDGKVVRRQN